MVILYAILYLVAGVVLCVVAELRDESASGFSDTVRAICVVGWPVFIFMGTLSCIVQKVINLLDGK